MFAASWQPVDSSHFAFHRVPVIRGPSFLRAWSFARGCERIVPCAGCDLIFSLERTLRQDVYRAGDGVHREWLAERRRHVSPVKRAALQLNPLHATLLALERRTFSPQRTRWVIANSRRGKEEIVRHYHFPVERIDVVHNGVDVERFRPAPAPRAGADRVLLFVGSGFERKGLRFCIEALARLPSSYRLKVVGKGNEAVYRSLARRLGVASRLEFCGFNLDPAAVYQGADLLVHPAIYEPFANVCLEALASGLPVVTSRINGASEVLTPGVNGAIIEQPDDIQELTAAINSFLDPARLEAASREARKTAEAHPFAANVAATLEVLFRAWTERVEHPGAP